MARIVDLDELPHEPHSMSSSAQTTAMFRSRSSWFTRSRVSGRSCIDIRTLKCFWSSRVRRHFKLARSDVWC
jgi:hypothetical protein